MRKLIIICALVMVTSLLAQQIVDSQGAGGGGSTVITVEDDDGTPSYDDINTIQFDGNDGYTLTNPGAGVAMVQHPTTGSFGFYVISNSPNITDPKILGVIEFNGATWDACFAGNYRSMWFDTNDERLEVCSETTGDPTIIARWTESVDLASAATLALENDNDLYHITGTTGITTINTCDGDEGGREVTLIFDDALTVTDGSNLKLAGNFTTTADDVLKLKCDGSNWYEISRSVN